MLQHLQLDTDFYALIGESTDDMIDEFGEPQDLPENVLKSAENGASGSRAGPFVSQSDQGGSVGAL